MINFPKVTFKEITSSQIDKIKLNRKSYPYSYALELARLIILNYSPDISSGKERMLSLLFDMNQLWEEYVLKQLQKESYKTLHIVLGMVRDKAVEDLVELFPKQAVYYFCSPALDRGMKVNKLAQIFNANGYQGQTYSSVNEALSSAKQLATPQDLIFVGGSTFVVAEVV